MMELLLKASFGIGIAHLFYKLLLQQESFFSANRLYLISCIVLAFALPFVSLPPLVSQQGYLTAMFEKRADPVADVQPAYNSVAEEKTAAGQQNIAVAMPQQQEEQKAIMKVQEELPVVEEAKEEFSFMFWLTVLYLFGVGVFTFSLLFQLANVAYKIMTATDKIQDGDCVIVNTANRQAPCSFFRYIFIYPDDYDFETYEQIIAHEKTHARLGHSLDMLMAEIAVIILWFNPLAWLLKREIEKNNEYQTDAMLLEKEQVQREQYQLNLLQIAVPNKPLSITTNYNQSLLKQRIMMMNARKSTPHAYWKYAFLLPLFFGVLLLLNEPAVSQDKSASSQTTGNEQEETLTDVINERVNQSIRESLAGDGQVLPPAVPEVPHPEGAPVPAVPKEPLPPVRESVGPKRGTAGPQRGLSINIQGGQTDMSEGYWYSHRENGNYCIDFKGNRGASNWNMSRCFNAGNFQKKGNDVFVMTKETGTLQLTGNLDAEVGQGKYSFKEDSSFKKYLADNNISSRNQNLMFHLFFGDVSKGYVDFLRQQYGSVSGDRLLELAIHGVTQEQFKGYLALFQKHSNKIPSIQEVVEARIHGIDEAYVQQIQKMGFQDLSLKKMMEAKIHGVNAAYVEGLKGAGFSSLPMDKIIEAKIHGVTPAAVKEMKSLGFGELSLDKIIELKIHGVSAAYINDLKSAGLGDLTQRQVVEAKIHGLSAASIKEIRAMGFKDLAFRDLITAKIHGVNAAYVEDLKKAGFENLSMNKIVEAKIHGINSNFIQQARQNGYNLNSIDKYISLKIHGNAMESLKEK